MIWVLITFVVVLTAVYVGALVEAKHEIKQTRAKMRELQKDASSAKLKEMHAISRIGALKEANEMLRTDCEMLREDCRGLYEERNTLAQQLSETERKLKIKTDVLDNLADAAKRTAK